MARSFDRETEATWIDQLARDGYCVLEDILSESQCAEVLERLFEQAEAERLLGLSGRDQAQSDESNQYVYSLVNKGHVFLDLLESSRIRVFVDYLLGQEYLLSAMDGVLAHPNGSLMPLHTDQWWMPPPVKRGDEHERAGAIKRFRSGDKNHWPEVINPPVVCNVLWMISPFTAENGATRVVPGTHLSGLLPDPSVPHPVRTIAATGRPGSALVLDGRIWHSTGANTTANTRFGIATAYCGPQFRPMENYTVGATDALLHRASDRMLRQLFGFKVWQGYGKIDRPGEEFIRRDSISTGPLSRDGRPISD
jgi:ectoine hydroxylase-related dioxygenase (phytanoyl-CoA dioxygenase family)